MLIRQKEYENPVLSTDGTHTWFDKYEKEYECNKCGAYIHESYPHHAEPEKDYHLCWDCCFLEGLIESGEFLKYSGGLDSICDAYRHEGEIVYVKKGRQPPWEKSTESRFTPEYKEWRKAVYERDDYTCQKCGKKGGNLNAHHIKAYAEYPDLRIELDNGITLCEECHKKEHWGD